MSQITDAQNQFFTMQAAAVGATYLLRIGGTSYECSPSEQPFDPMFVSGGVADSGTLQVMVRKSDFGSPPVRPVKLTEVTIFYDTPRAMTRHILEVSENESSYILTLGDVSAQ